MIWLYNIALG